MMITGIVELLKFKYNQPIKKKFCYVFILKLAWFTHRIYRNLNQIHKTISNQLSKDMIENLLIIIIMSNV